MDNERDRPIPVGKIKLFDGSVLDCYPPCRKGETRLASVKSFNEAWKNFANINSRYKEAKDRFRAYSMRESMFILSERHRVNIDQHVDPLLYSECMHRGIENMLRQTFHKSELHDRQ